MRHFYVILIAACALAVVGHAQDSTNAPKTEIELFEAQTGAVIIKGFSDIGSMTTDAGVITVNCKESADTTTGRKEYGIAISYAGNDHFKERLVVDYNEINSLVGSLNYLSGITYDVTSLSGFEAAYSTKSGLRIVAYGSQRQTAIQTFMQYSDDYRKILLTPDQMAQLAGLIGQAKTALDSLRTPK